MSDRTVRYLMSGKAHLPYLVVSLEGLRNKANWGGEVVVEAYEESIGLVKEIRDSGDYDISIKQNERKVRGKNSQFINKIAMMKGLPGHQLYLDADTLPLLSLETLFDAVGLYGFMATQFCDWVTNSRMISGRLKTLLDVPEIPTDLVMKLAENPYPSVNGGVWGTTGDTPLLETWLAWSLASKHKFICDEKVLHLLPLTSQGGVMGIAKDGVYNCSPKYQPKDLLDDEVAIYHFHGDSCVRPEKSQKGYDIWWPIFKKCLEENKGRLRDWLSQSGNQRITQLLGAGL